MDLQKEIGRPVILIFINHYLPGFKAGGPMRSVSNIVSWLGDDFYFKIITTDRDAGDKDPYKGIEINAWNKVGKAEVYYTDIKNIGLNHFWKLLTNTSFDAVYLNSFWNSRFSILPIYILKYLMGFEMSKVLIAPRGEFSKGALETSSTKKKIFTAIVNFFNVYNNVRWQATSELEKERIKKVLNIKNENIITASNLPQINNNGIKQQVRKEKGSLNIIYLSRVTPKKNLDYALNVLSKIEDIDIKFDIFGIISDENYWQNCKNMLRKLPENVDVKYKGVIEYQEVISKLSGYHLFLLPTKGENFGHAIYEAMLAGTPVLISDETPWLDLEQKELGWSIPLADNQRFTQAIHRIADMNETEMKELKKKVREKIIDLDISETRERTRVMFETVTN